MCSSSSVSLQPIKTLCLETRHPPGHEEYVQLGGECVGEAEPDEAGVDGVAIEDGQEGGEDDQQVGEALQPTSAQFIRKIDILIDLGYPVVLEKQN